MQCGHLDSCSLADGLLISLDFSGERRMKYRLEWLLCLGLFGAGIIWSRLLFPSDFYKVANIHDLFEILGAVATVVAASFAVYGIGLWRKQIRATSDHELARRVAISVELYKEEVKRIWGSAEFSATQLKTKEDYKHEKVRRAVKQTFDIRIERAICLRSDLKALLVECNAIWGKSFGNELRAVFGVEQQCLNCATNFLRVINPDYPEVGVLAAKSSIESNWKSLGGDNYKNFAESEEYIDTLFKGVISQLGLKLLR